MTTAPAAQPLSGRRLALIRGTWGVLVAVSWLAYLAGLAAHYQELSVVYLPEKARTWARL